MSPRIFFVIAILGLGYLGACDDTQPANSNSMGYTSEPNYAWHRPRSTERLDERRKWYAR